MNQIMKFFGGAIVMSLCTVLVLGILFSPTFYKGKGSWLKALGIVAEDVGAKQEVDKVYASDAAVKRVREEEVPQIVVNKSLEVGKTYDLTEVFKSAKGESFASVSVLELAKLKRDQTKEDALLDAYSRKGQSLTFSKKGNYFIRVCATDNRGIQQTSSFYLGVER